MAHVTEDGQGKLAKATAALMRMQAHSLSSQAELLASMAEKLREQADRIEHGGELPDLRVVEETEEEAARELPRMESDDGVAARGVDWPDWAQAFLLNFHPNYKTDPHFAQAWNEVAAGHAPTVALGNAVVQRVRELDL